MNNKTNLEKLLNEIILFDPTYPPTYKSIEKFNIEIKNFELIKLSKNEMLILNNIKETYKDLYKLVKINHKKSRS